MDLSVNEIVVFTAQCPAERSSAVVSSLSVCQLPWS